MFMVRNERNEYLASEPRGFTNIPRVVARFVNETSMRQFLRDGYPHVQGTLDLIDMDTGRITKVKIDA